VERAEAGAILDGDRGTAVALLMRVDELVEANLRLEARVGELEQRLSRSSRNSSLPPSQDPPSAPPRSRRPASGRRPGGQPGHEGRNRRLLPLEQLDEVVEHWPARCAHSFGESERIEAASPQRHQVSELPVIAVTVTEHRLHRLRCPLCAAETRAVLPTEVPRGAFGPRLQAAVTTLAVRNRVSRRDSAELVRELFGVELATGSVDAIVQRVGETLAEPHARLAEQIRSAAVVNIDETGWRTAGERRTLWGALTAQAALFRIAAGRHQREVKALLERATRKSTKTKYHRQFANNLLKRWPALWTFTTTNDVEPTNNHPERGLRGAVIYRKLSLGSQSHQRERTIERLLSASVTCRLQRRSLFAYLTDVLNANIRGDPIPLLA
jgi:hypothetical protein